MEVNGIGTTRLDTWNEAADDGNAGQRGRRLTRWMLSLDLDGRVSIGAYKWWADRGPAGRSLPFARFVQVEDVSHRRFFDTLRWLPGTRVIDAIHAFYENGRTQTDALPPSQPTMTPPASSPSPHPTERQATNDPSPTQTAKSLETEVLVSFSRQRC
jgi:hypothetical protein